MSSESRRTRSHKNESLRIKHKEAHLSLCSLRWQRGRETRSFQLIFIPCLTDMNDLYVINCHNEPQTDIMFRRQKLVRLSGLLIVTEFRWGPSASSEGTKWQRSASKRCKKNYVKVRRERGS